MKPQVKFCGITRFEDAQLAIELGVDALGFNFYSKSPRSLSLSAAQVSGLWPPSGSKVYLRGGRLR